MGIGCWERKLLLWLYATPIVCTPGTHTPRSSTIVFHVEPDAYIGMPCIRHHRITCTQGLFDASHLRHASTWVLYPGALMSN